MLLFVMAARIDDKMVDAIRKLLQLLISSFGPSGTLALFLGLFAILVAWKIWNEVQANRYIDLLLKEKEAAIQKLSNENREDRAIFLMRAGGLSAAEVERLVRRNEDFASPKEAVEKLEPGQRKRGRPRRS